MGNQLLTISMVTEEGLMILENDLGFALKCSRDYDDSFARKGAKIGNVINIRKPIRVLTSKGQALDVQDATETSVPLALTEQAHIDLAFSTFDLTLSIDDFAKRFLKPRIVQIANTIDFDGTGQYVNVYNTIGTPGVVPNDTDVYLAAGQRLSDEAAPLDNRNLCITPKMERFAVGAFKGLYNPQPAISKVIRKGMFGENLLGFEGAYMDQNLRMHQFGAQGGSPQVNGANQTGNSLITNGWTAAIAQRMNVGDVFTIANVFAVNPQNRQSTGDLRQFVVTAPASTDGAGNMTIQISPAITPGGPSQTTDSTAVNGAAITLLGSANQQSSMGLAFAEEAFVMGTADLYLPSKGVVEAARAVDDQLNISMRIIHAYDINMDREPSRVDVIYGFATTYPEMAVRIVGS